MDHLVLGSAQLKCCWYFYCNVGFVGRFTCSWWSLPFHCGVSFYWWSKVNNGVCVMSSPRPPPIYTKNKYRLLAPQWPHLLLYQKGKKSPKASPPEFKISPCHSLSFLLILFQRTFARAPPTKAVPLTPFPFYLQPSFHLSLFIFSFFSQTCLSFL